MTAPIVETKITTDVAPVVPDVKASTTALGVSSAPTVEETATAKALTDAADAKAKADADAGKTPEAIKAEADKALADKAKDVVPEKYEFKTSETVKLDETAVTEASTVFKELNLSQDKAQKVMDIGVRHFEKVVSQMKESQEKALLEAGEAWRKEIETDKQFGGQNFKKSNEAAILFRDRFTSPEERKALSALFDSAWGNHPVLWKVFVRAGQALREDRTVDGGVTIPPVSAAKIMFPNMK